MANPTVKKNSLCKRCSSKGDYFSRLFSPTFFTFNRLTALTKKIVEKTYNDNLESYILHQRMEISQVFTTIFCLFCLFEIHTYLVDFDCFSAPDLILCCSFVFLIRKIKEIQSNLALRNFLVTTKKFLKVKSSLFQTFNQSTI